MSRRFRKKRYSDRDIDFCNDSFLINKRNEFIMSLLIYCYQKKNYKGLDYSFYEYILDVIDDTIVEKIIKKFGDNQDSEDINSLAHAFEKNSKIREEYFGRMKAGFKAYYEKNKIIYKNSYSAFKKNLYELKRVLKISDIEANTILALYLLEATETFRNIFGGLRSEPNKKLYFLSIFLNRKPYAIKKLFTADSALRRYGIVDSELDLENKVTEFLSGLSNEPLISNFYRLYKGPVLPLEYFSRIDTDLKVITALIKGKKTDEGINILLYGVPGVGKTEFIKSLSSNLELDLYEIKSYDKEEDDERFRYSAINVSMNTVDPKKSIILIDEADELLNGSAGLFSYSSRNSDKNKINEIIDNSKHICVWITNTYEFIAESTRRRFDYSVEFKKLNINNRKHIWKNSLKKYGLIDRLSEENIESLAKKYDISAGGINIAAKHCQKIMSIDKNISINYAIETLIKSHSKIMDTVTGSKVEINSTNYSLEGINIKSAISLDRIIKVAKKFLEYKEANTETLIRNMNLLFYGPPGTGKTEFAKHIAFSLDTGLIIKTAGDFLNMYVGGTEKNIRRNFEEAEETGSILFIDEIDSLIMDRSKSVRSWEVSQVNEILSCLENFRGILICATNHKISIDNASIRRFNFKIEFDYLDIQGKEIFFERILAPVTGKKLSEAENLKLLAIDYLTPGDFKVVWQKFAFYSKGELSNEFLIEELGNEVKSKNGIKHSKVGFLKC